MQPNPGRLGTRDSIGASLGLLLVALALLGAMAAPEASPAVGAAQGSRASGTAITPPQGLVLNTSGLTPTTAELNWSEPTLPLFQNLTIFSSTEGPRGPWTPAGVVTDPAARDLVETGLAPGTGTWWTAVASTLNGSLSSKPIHVEQPPAANLTETPYGPNGLTFTWTNNATYAGLIAFDSYQLLESINGAAWIPIAWIFSVGTLTTEVTGLAATSSYSFELVTTDSCAGCVGAASNVTSVSNVATFGVPFPLTARILSPPTVADEGQAVGWLCSALGGTPPYAYLWNFGDGNATPGGPITGHAFGGTGATAVRCTVTDARGNRSVATATIVLEPPPYVFASANASSPPVGSAVGLRCAASSGTPPYAYSWTVGGRPAGGGASALVRPDSPGLLVASCAITDGAGVTSSSSLVLHVMASSAGPAAPPNWFGLGWLENRAHWEWMGFGGAILLAIGLGARAKRTRARPPSRAIGPRSSAGRPPAPSQSESSTTAPPDQDRTLDPVVARESEESAPSEPASNPTEMLADMEREILSTFGTRCAGCGALNEPNARSCAVCRAGLPAEMLPPP